ncbi:MAG TPA: nuclear transport factor 2 family protein [Sphingopyxis sp.]|jgi:ketosteroid isomerase-like protein|uniref:nuclear transport factor 2 family protein n=1 Tax=Sphingopyxis sp. TaxID=1908224 RepID=UPI002E11902D|nr:nuclear transport factor 2 family protein [Sphingopyxis sp.]
MNAADLAHRGIAAWHAYMEGGGDPQALRDMLAEDAVFHSPVVHSPQAGRDKVFAYLHAASHVLGGDDFRYEREIIDGDQAMLEFATTLDGIHINGVDIIRWNDDGKIMDFKVMVRPLKAINKVWEKMGEMLAAQG